jgi:biopolymer transport protein ExbD
MRWVFVALLFACVPPAEEASNAVIDPSSLVLPSSTSALPANEDLPTVILTKSKLMVVGVPRGAMNVPITIEYMDGPIITPLREWLKHPSIHGKDVAIAFDSDVTAETAMEVMATCLEAGMNVFHLAVSKEGTTAQIPLEFGKPDPPGARAITASVFRGGVVLKVPEGSIGPGCEQLGEGVTISRLDGLIDRDKLGKCIARVHAAHKTTTASVVVTKDTEFHEVVTLLDALRKDASTEAISLGISN